MLLMASEKQIYAIMICKCVTTGLSHFVAQPVPGWDIAVVYSLLLTHTFQHHTARAGTAKHKKILNTSRSSTIPIHAGLRSPPLQVVSDAGRRLELATSWLGRGWTSHALAEP